MSRQTVWIFLKFRVLCDARTAYMDVRSAATNQSEIRARLRRYRIRTYARVSCTSFLANATVFFYYFINRSYGAQRLFGTLSVGGRFTRAVRHVVVVTRARTHYTRTDDGQPGLS